jgi:hypothetical protein
VTLGDDSRDEFDRIVEGLELELPDDLDLAAPTPAPEPATSGTFLDAYDDEVHETEAAYRNAPPVSRSVSRNIIAAWCGLALGPLVVFFTMASSTSLPRELGYLLVALSVGSAIYLFTQLPEQGPSDPYDNGAQL